MNIGDLFLRILAEDREFRADLQKKAAAAGDESGATLGQRMGQAIKSNLGRLLSAGGAIVGGIALKGLKELGELESYFRAETGATEEAAREAGKAILKLSADNIQPMREIGLALTKVHTDMGLVGDAATDMTARILKFARVSGRDASEEVAAFDDILDAWSLTAKDAQAVMDALIVSHQRFGGAISDDETALVALAPTLLASNQSWRDGITLINLFKDSGVDATTMVTGLSKALQKVSSPEQLQRLIDDIIATEDPLQRAAKASDLFGAKAGPKLAAVLKPGVEGLEKYRIGADDAAGATDRAAEALDSEFGARFQLLIKKAGTAIIAFGNDWGGLATVIATTLTVAGGLGGGKIGPLLAKGWTSAANSQIVTRAVAAASSKMATLYLAALIAGDKISSALSTAWNATGGKIIAAAGLQGAAAGRAFAIAAGIAIAAAPVAVLLVALKIADDVKEAKGGLASQIDRVIEEGTLEGLQRAKATLQAQIGSQKILGIIPFQFAGEVDAMNQQIARIDAAIAAIPPQVQKTTTATQQLDQKSVVGWGHVTDAAKNAKDAIQKHADSIARRVTDLTATLLGQATALINGYYDPIIARDELLVLKDTVKADTIARNATKAGTAERHQADLTLANSQKNLDQTRANLLASGQLTKKEQKDWLDELQKRYKTATGDAKTKIGELIAKLKELQGVKTTVVHITALIDSKVAKNTAQPRAGGGDVVAGQAYLVNENTPNSELWVPQVSGTVYPDASTLPASARMGGNTTYITNVAGLLRARTPDEVGSALRRLSDFGVLPPRPVEE